MRCTRVECFAFSVKEQNNCTALTKVEAKCRFYKTKVAHAREKQDLIDRGKPYYEPARSFAEIKILRQLLGSEDDGREDNIHQIGQEHS